MEDPQSVIRILFDEMRKVSELSDTTRTKIFLPNQFSILLEESMGIKNIKRAGLGGFPVEYGPFSSISAYNKEANLKISISTRGEILK
jgi:hypothetical protein